MEGNLTQKAVARAAAVQGGPGVRDRSTGFAGGCLRVAFGFPRRWYLRDGLRRGHVALAVEEASGIDDQAGRVDVSEDDAVFLDLQALGGVDDALYFSGDADDAGADFPLDFTLIVDDDRAFTQNLALDVGVDAEQT